ncbi:MAG: alanine dehydrogenase [Deltaproteobacteria bacterium]|nr:alanine dehydrogenase [Deltaproteobacteria bacterium]
MIVGVLKEIKTLENRACMTPSGVEEMRGHGNEVLVEKGAGIGSGFEDKAYQAAGAEIVKMAKEIYERADMVMHVKEPLPSEYPLIRKGQIVFTYLHLAADGKQTKALMKSKCVAIAYETVQRLDRSLPLLVPMSEVAGRMSIQEGAKYLESPTGGSGLLLGGVPGVDPATVLVIGAGTVGMHAAKMACGLGAKVYMVDAYLPRLRYLSEVMSANCFLLKSSPATTPKMVTREMIKTMKKGSVMVDVAIDQGGCFETSKATTHADPVFTVDGVIHYCVANMPGAVARTSTLALTNATLPYALEIADKGWAKAMQDNPDLKSGANVIKGKVTFGGVAEAFGLEYVPVEKLWG